METGRNSGHNAGQLELISGASTSRFARRRLDRAARARGLAGVARARQALAVSCPPEGRLREAS
ncbi:MAG: hypothetical protein HYU28_03155 [Actinobacteria bacterium]|nr:hypothetical protein [Actinomycetota bacterium]